MAWSGPACSIGSVPARRAQLWSRLRSHTIRCVMASRLLAAVLATALGLLPVAPPEHVHEAEEHGHAHAVIHRHLEPHGILNQHHANRHPELKDDDGPVLTLTAAYTGPLAAFTPAAPQVAGVLIEPPSFHAFERPFADVDLLIHGPPRAPTPPRAPPSIPTT